MKMDNRSSATAELLGTLSRKPWMVYLRFWWTRHFYLTHTASNGLISEWNLGSVMESLPHRLTSTTRLGSTFAKPNCEPNTARSEATRSDLRPKLTSERPVPAKVLSTRWSVSGSSWGGAMVYNRGWEFFSSTSSWASCGRLKESFVQHCCHVPRVRQGMIPMR